MLKKLSGFLLLLFVVATLGACNTMSGLGKDVKSAGEALEDTAEDNK